MVLDWFEQVIPTGKPGRRLTPQRLHGHIDCWIIDILATRRIYSTGTARYRPGQFTQ